MIDKDQRCQGCGAPIKGRTCEYCGRVFEVERAADGLTFHLDGNVMARAVGHELDRLQYQASQERQMAFLLENLRKSNNVAANSRFSWEREEV